METYGRAHLAEGRDGNAQLRGGADAIREAISRGRRCTHRSTDGGEGTESRGFGRGGAGSSAERILRFRQERPDRELFEDLPAAYLEGATLLVVDDVDAPPVRHRQRIRPAAPARRTRLCDKLARGIADAG